MNHRGAMCEKPNKSADKIVVVGKRLNIFIKHNNIFTQLRLLLRAKGFWSRLTYRLRFNQAGLFKWHKGLFFKKAILS